MNTIWYVPIFKWSFPPDEVDGIQHGLTIYNTLEDLYGFNPEAVGHFSLSGEVFSKSQFEARDTSEEIWR